MLGPRNKTDGLWDIVIPLPTASATPVEAQANQQINAIIREDTSKTQLVKYLYGCCCSPKTSTWKKAIRNGNFITWPGINNLSINTQLPNSIESAKGHLNQERKNTRMQERKNARMQECKNARTQECKNARMQERKGARTCNPLASSQRPSLETDVMDETDEGHFPLPDTPNVKTFEACAMLVPFTAKNTAYHDLTGRFPHRSSRGNEYLIVVDYDHDSNSILAIALKNKAGAGIKSGSWLLH